MCCVHWPSVQLGPVQPGVHTHCPLAGWQMPSLRQPQVWLHPSPKEPVGHAAMRRTNNMITSSWTLMIKSGNSRVWKVIQAAALGTSSCCFLMCDWAGFSQITLKLSKFLFHSESELQRCSLCFKPATYMSCYAPPELLIETFFFPETEGEPTFELSLTEVAEWTHPASRTGANSADVITAPTIQTQTFLLTVQPIETLRTRWNTHTHMGLK